MLFPEIAVPPDSETLLYVLVHSMQLITSRVSTIRGYFQVQVPVHVCHEQILSRAVCIEYITLGAT